MRYFRLPAVLAAVTSALLAAAMIVAASPANAKVNVPSRVNPAVARVLTAATGKVHRHYWARVRVRPGETLYRIAADHYGNGALWPALWWINKAKIRNPNVIVAGQTVKLSWWHPQERWLDRAALTAIPGPAHARHAIITSRVHRVHHLRYRHSQRRSYRISRHARITYGTYSFAGLEALWVAAGGPAWAEASAARVAECESGGRTNAYNPSGATGLWQILGAVVPGNLYNPYVNALNAVAKFRASGDTWSQWVCRP